METQSKLKSAFDIVYKLAELLTAIFFILLCLSVTVQVIARYFFNLAFDWGEELPIFLFLWVSFLAAAIAYRDGSHLSVDFIVARVSQKSAVCDLLHQSDPVFGVRIDRWLL